MKFIDLHCDTASCILDMNIPLLKNNICVDIEKLKTGEAFAQFFAMFIDKKEIENPYFHCKNMIENFKRELKINKESIELCTTYEQLMEIERKKKIAAFMSIEEGGVLLGDIDKLKEFKEDGISLITLSWNYENEIAYPNVGFFYKDKGLKSKGIEFVEAMNDLKIIIDTSHLSDGGFYDCLKHSKLPIVASHSNSRVMTNHSRNLTDDMIKLLADNGGVMGLNFCSAFLLKQQSKTNNEVSRIKDMIRHLKHIKNVAGVDVICLGSDFDGISNPVEIKDASYMSMLADELLKNGFKNEEIEKIFYKNALRVIKDTL